MIKSFWGWGWEERFPDRETRRGFGTMASALIGFDPPGLDDPPSIDSVALRPSKLAVPSSLGAFCADDREARIRHTYGAAYRDVARAFRGLFENPPDLVATPSTEAEIVAVLDWAADARVAVFPFGGGTSVVGAVEPIAPEGYAGTLSLDLRRLDRVLEIDAVSRAARIQAGATGPRLEAQLGEAGLTLRCFPQSFEHSTLGGWIATRAGGHFATVYTHIDDLVESTRMITPRGVLETRRLPASGAGPSPDRLVLGSEGTLGVITEAWVRVRPKPTFRATATVFFADYDRAVKAVRAIAQSGLHPTNCRLLDAREAMLNGVATDGSHVLVLGFESHDHLLEPWIARALTIAEEHEGRCPDGARCSASGERTGEGGGAGRWKSAFLEGPYLQNVLVSLGVIADTFETACTWDRFEALHAAIRDRVGDTMRRVCGAGSISCRFTHVYPDGPAPYYTFLAPGRRGAELEQWAAIKRVASDTLLAHGATITHHHAVGRTHQPWYAQQRPPLFAEALRAVKATLDPARILSPGVLLDP